MMSEKHFGGVMVSKDDKLITLGGFDFVIQERLSEIGEYKTPTEADFLLKEQLYFRPLRYDNK